MAKNSTPRPGAPARVRLVVLDAEIPDGDFSALASVLQNALRTNSPTIVQRVTTTNGTKAIQHQPEVDADAEEDVEEEVVDTDEIATPRPARTKRSTPRTPKIVTIDMNAPVSLATFAAGKDAKSQHKKYLIASAWLKEHRDTDAVTGDHIYTCFRSMGWSTNIPDFGQPLRDLKAKLQYYDKSDKGYEINHIGLDYVKKLGGSDGAA